MVINHSFFIYHIQDTHFILVIVNQILHILVLKINLTLKYYNFNTIEFN